MTKRLKYIAPLQLGLVQGALCAAVSLIAVPFLILGSMLAPKGAGFGIILIIFIPVMYAVFGFISGIISAAVYNLVAGWIGGIEFTTVEVPSQQIV